MMGIGFSSDDIPDDMENMMRMKASLDKFEEAVTGNTVADIACDDDGDITDEERNAYNQVKAKIWRKEAFRVMNEADIPDEMQDHFKAILQHLQEDATDEPVDIESFIEDFEESVDGADLGSVTEDFGESTKNEASDEESFDQEEAVDIGFDGGDGD
jgi:hypothetical protein